MRFGRISSSPLPCNGPRRPVPPALLNRVASPRTVRTASYRVASQASVPHGRVMRLIADSSRIRTNSGTGSNRSRRMCTGIIGVSVIGMVLIKRYRTIV